MTLLEIYQEQRYRFDERIAILCEDREPTQAQMDIAAQDEQEWLKRFKAEKSNTQRQLL